MRINQNIMANNASRNLSNTNVMLGKSLEKLSSGFRINRAADDAAGLVVSQGLRAQIGGLKQAARNAQDGISVVQTAEGALNEVHTMLNRMRDLSVQSANSGGNDLSARQAAQAEITALATEIDRVSSQTRFGNTKLLDGNYGVTNAQITGTSAATFTTLAASSFTLNINGLGVVTVNIGAAAAVSGATAASNVQAAINSALSASATPAVQAFAGKVTVSAVAVANSANTSLKIDVSGLTNTQTFALTDSTNAPLAALGLGGAITAAAGTGGTFQIGANANETVGLSIAKSDSLTLGVNALVVTTDVGAALAITALDTAISTVSTIRGNLGALQNRFESMINNLQVTTENLSASESRIRDTDMAQEMVTFTKNNVLMQAGTAMLSQANQVPNSILSLLR